MKPHRGVLILTLGILSVVGVCILCAPFAWIMGRNDLNEIKRGRMDPSGETITTVGMVLGIVGTIMMAIGCVGSLLWVFLIGGMAALGGLG